ncbi:hypothetical protein Tco_1035610 [Tanacetum coccineum]
MADLALVKQHNMVAYLEKTEENVEFHHILDFLTSSSINFAFTVLDLEKEKDAQAVEILKLKKRVKKLERQRKLSISHPRRRIYRQVESSDDDLDEEDASKQGRTSDKTKPMFKDSDFDDLDDLVDEGMDFIQEKDVENQGKISVDDTEVVTQKQLILLDVTMAMAQTLIKMKEEKAKEKGVAIKDIERDAEGTLQDFSQAKLLGVKNSETGKEDMKKQRTIREPTTYYKHSSRNLIIDLYKSTRGGYKHTVQLKGNSLMKKSNGKGVSKIISLLEGHDLLISGESLPGIDIRPG